MTRFHLPTAQPTHPPVFLVFVLVRFCSRSGYVRRPEHPFARVDLHGRLCMAWHWRASRCRKRDSRGQYDGVSFQAPKDASKYRLRRRWSRIKSKKRAGPAQRARETEKGGGDGCGYLLGVFRGLSYKWRGARFFVLFFFCPFWPVRLVVRTLFLFCEGPFFFGIAAAARSIGFGNCL